VLVSFFAPGGSFATGWTAYAPLSTETPLGQTFFKQSRCSFAGAIVGGHGAELPGHDHHHGARPGMTFSGACRCSCGRNFTTSLLVVIATPFIAGSQFMVLFDRALGTHFFDPSAGGDVLMYQHVFWFYSHPAVYIMMLPRLSGSSARSYPRTRASPIFGYRMMAFSLMGDRAARLSTVLWGAPTCFVSGMFPWLRVADDDHDDADRGGRPASRSSPWLATLWRGVIHLRTPDAVSRLGFITMFHASAGIKRHHCSPVIPPSTSTCRTRTSSSRTSTTCCSAGACSRSSAGIYHWFPEDDRADVRRDAREESTSGCRSSSST